jgi:protocatechuate 3,4-dioxygenase beta subunit
MELRPRIAVGAVLAAALVFVVAGIAQQRGETAGVAADAQAKPELKPGSVTGQIVDEQSQQGVRKVLVTLTYNPPGAANPEAVRTSTTYQAVTDAGGNFSFPSVVPSRYAIAAERVGYLPLASTGASGGGSSGARRVEVAEGQKVSGVLVKLRPQAALSGRVTDEDDDPLQNINVQLFRYRFSGGRRQLASAGSGRTNDLGVYRISGVNPGRYYISVNANNAGLEGGGIGEGGFSFVRVNVDTKEAYVPTFYPGVPQIASAVQVDLRPGADVRGIDMRMRKTAVFTVKGTVQGIAIADPNAPEEANPFGGRGGRGGAVGGPPGGPNVTTVSLSSSSIGQLLGENLRAQVAADGAFEIRNVRAGTYMLTARQGGPAGSAAGVGGRLGRVPVVVGESGVESLVVMMNPAFNLKGGVTAPAPQPENLGGVVVLLAPTEDQVLGSVNARTEADGKFTASILEPAKFHVSASNLPQGYYLRSVHYGTTDVTSGGLDLTSGVAAGELEIRIAPGAGAVSGSVTREGGPGAGALVAIIPEEPYKSWAELYRTTNTSQNGSFTFANVRPGRYRLYAFEAVEPGSNQDPEFIKRFEADGKSINLVEKGSEAVQLKLITVEQVQ